MLNNSYRNLSQQTLQGKFFILLQNKKQNMSISWKNQIYYQLLHSNSDILHLCNNQTGFELRLFKNYWEIQQQQVKINNAESDTKPKGVKVYNIRVEELREKQEDIVISKQFKSVEELKQYLVNRARFTIDGNTIIITDKQQTNDDTSIVGTFKLKEQILSSLTCSQLTKSLFKSSQLDQKSIQCMLLNITCKLDQYSSQSQSQQILFLEKSKQINIQHQSQDLVNESKIVEEQELIKINGQIRQISNEITNIKDQMKNKIMRVMLQIEKTKNSILEDFKLSNKKFKSSIDEQPVLDLKNLQQKVAMLQKKTQFMPSPISMPPMPMPMPRPIHPNFPGTMLPPQMSLPNGIPIIGRPPNSLNPPVMPFMPPSSVNSMPPTNYMFSSMNNLKRIKINQIKPEMVSLQIVAKVIELKKVKSVKSKQQSRRRASDEYIAKIGDETGIIEVYCPDKRNLCQGKTFWFHNVNSYNHKGRLQLKFGFCTIVRQQLIDQTIIKDIKTENNFSIKQVESSIPDKRQASVEKPKLIHDESRWRILPEMHNE